MRNLFTAFIALLGLAVISCQKLQDNGVVEQERYIPISLGFAGEITDITTRPMTRENGASDWYQIQVYSSPIGQSNYSYYGYGFFDGTENMVINLKEGYQYKFVADMIVDGGDYVRYFCLVNSGWASIGNSFYLSYDEHIRYLGNGYLYMKEDTFNRPDIDRFFGITEGYIPTEKGKVSIKMKRVSFGVKFLAQDFTDGKIEVAIDQAPTHVFNATNGSETDKITLSFYNTLKAYYNDKYTENIAVNVIWVKNDGTRVPVISKAIDFQRNHLTTIKFKLTDEASKSNAFSILAEEDWQIGEIIEIENDGIDTEVKP